MTGMRSETAIDGFSAAELTWLDGAGHFSPLEAPAGFAAAVAAAVTR